jgi:hypothetical protein
MDVELTSSDLEVLLNRLPPSGLRHLRLCAIYLSKGKYAQSLDILKSIKRGSSNCAVDLSSLEGAEFGPSQYFDDSDILYGGKERREAGWKRLEEHINPGLLRQTSAYILGDEPVNPLLGISCEASQ